jgi:hypothetical protein
MYEEEISAAWGEPNIFETEDFAGIFINKDRQIVLMFVSDSAGYRNAITKSKRLNHVLISRDGKAQQPLVIRSAKHSFSQLKQTQEFLYKYRYKYDGVYSLSRNYEHNCIEIGLINNTDAESLRRTFVTMLEQSILLHIQSCYVPLFLFLTIINIILSKRL